MEDKHIVKIAAELALRERQVRATAQLLEQEATVPFIARYRKEVTGGLDEVHIIAIRDRLERLVELDKRRASILKSIEGQGELTEELRQKLDTTGTLAELEDIYLPYRPKRRTRGMVAKERGLEALAKTIFEQGDLDPHAEAVGYVDPERGVGQVEDALAGARDIIAEWVNEDTEARAELRKLFLEKATIQSKVLKGKAAEGIKYRDYFAWQEPAATAPSHRVLAIRRGAAEGFLSFHVTPQETEAIAVLERRFVKGEGEAAEQVRMALRDGYKRLLCPSLETEVRLENKKRADDEAIRVFAENLRHLLLAPPLGQSSVLALDPGLRTGCKLVCIDPQGKLLHSEAIFPLEPYNRREESAETLKALIERFSIGAIAVGNGTGGREARSFCQGIDFGRPVPVVMVNESGASVYSASQAARDEFPDEDVTVRGAVSIGRRLMDPLAELVKIDPRSIGVGQYQHDVDQTALKRCLGDVVMSCVNAVGVQVNTASRELLSYVSGLSERLAGNIIAYRNMNGPFGTRAELMQVSGMGPKTFEQAAGFLRIHGGDNPLDASGVHPESYRVVEAMASDLGCTVADLVRDPALIRRIEPQKYVHDTVGMPTVRDILEELEMPGRDLREPLDPFTFTEGINEISDLRVGMKIPGVITNVTAFGAFVDIGVHQDGLVHISELADRFVRNPHEVVKVQQKVVVEVIGVDLQRNRIALSMRRRRPREQSDA